MRAYELARELGVESKEVLARAADLGIEVAAASSGLDDDSVALIRLAFEEAATAAAAGVAPEESPAEPVTPAGPEPEAAPLSAPAAPTPVRPAAPLLSVRPGVTVSGLAAAAGRPVGEVVKVLLSRGQMAGAAQPVPPDHLEAVVGALGFILQVEDATAPAAAAPSGPRSAPARPTGGVRRPPVVTVMGHVDHGKTKLLDRIRTANVVAEEAGGITQHIGAYQVSLGERRITFIDTPGHEAFTSLRARGAEVTDIVVLVVAADDGVMPQTVEAISHAKAAGVPIVVAINKMDLPGAEPQTVRAQLTEHGLLVEQLGGDVVSAEVSALTGEGIDQLLEYLDLIAELEEFSADPSAPAAGTVVEAQLDRGRGPVATVIVHQGTLRRGDAIVAGAVAGRVRAMFDHTGAPVDSAPPSTPVLIMGWDDVPRAGDRFEVKRDERAARAAADEAADSLRIKELVMPTAADRLQSLLDELRSDEQAELRLIVKADTQGSQEAIREGVGKIGRSGGRITIVHAAVGGINENDVLLADATGSVIFGFGVRPDAKSRRAAEDAGIEIRTYRIIYEMLDDIEAMLVGRLAPEAVERVLGSAEVRAVFRSPRFGSVAGCYVTEGELARSARVRLVRDGVVVYEGSIASLRRFKDDARSVAAGFECGVGLESFKDVKEGDVIEAYEVQEVART
ncbi:MAG: translation initiation factor IF-2 [Actinobacteria bacterium]|nr:translation initiation factor IF-2 [Actinomycetota bacterium]